MRAAIAMVTAALAIGACSYFVDDAPDRSCDFDNQCFRAQGEICDQGRGVCFVPPDAGSRPDADEPDAAPPDAAPDAELPDAAPDGAPDAILFAEESP